MKEIDANLMNCNELFNDGLNHCDCLEEYSESLEQVWLLTRSDVALKLGRENMDDLTTKCWKLSLPIISYRTFDILKYDHQKKRCIEYYGLNQKLKNQYKKAVRISEHHLS